MTPLQALNRCKGRYGVISTLDVGVPLSGSNVSYEQSFASGLSELERAGWQLVACPTSTMMIFRRTRKRRRRA